MASKPATSNPGRAVLTMRLVRVGLLNPPVPVVYAAVQEKTPVTSFAASNRSKPESQHLKRLRPEF